MKSPTSATVTKTVKVTPLQSETLERLGCVESEYIREALDMRLRDEVPGYAEAEEELSGQRYSGTGWPE